jgi:RimJ/RimL family protein N-acetyltransferase
MEYRGKGVSKWLLRNGIQHFFTRHKTKLITAEVHIDNLPSKALFERAGFRRVSEANQFISFALDQNKYSQASDSPVSPAHANQH